MPQQKFDFEAYVINTLDSVNKKLDSLSTSFMPREETNLRFAEINKTQAETVKTLAEHTNLITKLRSTDDMQQGNIDASRRFISFSLAIAGIFMTGLFIYVTWRVGVGK